VRARHPRHVRGATAAALSGALLVAGCGGDDSSQGDDEARTETTATDEPGDATNATAGPVEDQPFPDVIDVEVERSDDGTYDFAVTISSPYDTPERYADGWRIVGPDDTVYGEHQLAHDHANEQPFTRTQSGVSIPDGVDEVTVEARDLENGFGGKTATVSVPTDDTDDTVRGY
jgi:hypothetical protein